MSEAKVLRAEASREGEAVRVQLELTLPITHVKKALPMIEMALNMNREVMSEESKLAVDNLMAQINVAISGAKA